MSTLGPIARALRRARPTIRRRLRTALLLPALATLVLGAPAGRAGAQEGEDFYKACIDKALALAENCKGDSNTWIGDRACEWVAGMLAFGCAALEAARKLGEGVSLPPPKSFF